MNIQVRNISNKGRGLFATHSFKKNEFLCEYAGELVSHKEGLRRETHYAEDPLHDNSKCFLYFFKHDGKKLWWVSLWF